MLDQQARALMQEIGPLADLLAVGEFEDHDVWRLVLDEETVIDADLDRTRGCLVLAAEIAQPEAADRARWLELMLQYNYQWAETGGARLAVAGPEGPVVLLADHPVAGLAAGDLGRRLGLFVGLVRVWREILTRPPAADDVRGAVPSSDMIRA